MKKTRKLLLNLTATIIVISSFTSCINNDIPDEVKGIYTGQANLLAAKSALLEADKNYKNAQAAYENARAAVENERAKAQEIANSLASAKNTIEISKLQAQLTAQLEQAKYDAEKAKQDLELAMLQWAQDKKKLETEIENTNIELVKEYFGKYTTNNYLLSLEKAKEITKQEQISLKTIENAIDTDTYEIKVAKLKNDLTELEEKKVALATKKTELEALIATGSNVDANEKKKAELESKIAKNSEAIAASSVKISEKEKEILDARKNLADLTGEDGLNSLRINYNTKKSELTSFLSDKENYENSNKVENEKIVAWQKIVNNYDVTPLEEAVSVAEAALVVAKDAELATLNDKEEKLKAYNVELFKVNDLKLVADAIVPELNNATSSYDNLLSAKESLAQNITTATTEKDKAQGVYDAAKGYFDDKTADATWVDPGSDGLLGKHDNDATSIVTYYKIKTVAANGEATFDLVATPIYNTALASTAPNEISTNGWGNFVQADVGKYFDVEADDEGGIQPPTDLQRLQSATNYLDTAKNTLANLKISVARNEAEITKAKNLYETLTTSFATAREDYEAQKIISDKAQRDYFTADEAHIEATNTLAEANNKLQQSKNELEIYTSTTKAQHEANIEGAKVTIDQNNIYIANAEKEITKLEKEIAELLVKINEGKTPEIIAAEKAVDDLTIEKDDLETEKSSLETSNAQMKIVVTAIKDAYMSITSLISATEGEIETNNSNIENKRKEIAGAINSETINKSALASLEAELLEIKGNVEKYSSLVVKYKNLLDSLL